MRWFLFLIWLFERGISGSTLIDHEWEFDGQQGRIVVEGTGLCMIYRLRHFL